jgi:hypothetical protein
VDEESHHIVSRVRFDEVQEHRAEADYRVNLEYERSIQWYMPGKYAASPGNELLDTSGNCLTPQEFYGDELSVQERIAESDGDENWFDAVEDSKEPDFGQESIKKMVNISDNKDLTVSDQRTTFKEDLISLLDRYKRRHIPQNSLVVANAPNWNWENINLNN